ncbi:MAG TPA: DUF1772 domain-containing protein [Candidatus Saccharimonadales bacterium]|nr:DUF1772 domain-containing protein [Candidatus Saccharimonadales bacterium]
MQRINKVIQNPLFFLVFMGPVILLPLTAYLSYKTGVSRQFYTLAGASLLYIILTFGVTVGGNVPLNNKLAAVPVASASAADLHKARTDFEGPWNGLHAVRTVAGIAASVLAITACILPAIDAKD